MVSLTCLYLVSRELIVRAGRLFFEAHLLYLAWTFCQPRWPQGSSSSTKSRRMPTSAGRKFEEPEGRPRRLVDGTRSLSLSSLGLGAFSLRDNGTRREPATLATALGFLACFFWDGVTSSLSAGRIGSGMSGISSRNCEVVFNRSMEGANNLAYLIGCSGRA